MGILTRPSKGLNIWDSACSVRTCYVTAGLPDL